MNEVEYEATDGIGYLTLRAPKRRNALTLAMVTEIVAAMDALEADESVTTIVVSGSEGSFCAGADLGALGSLDDGVRKIYDGFLRIAQSPLPTIAAVDGPAVGAGFNLALCCDLRLATSRSRFITRFLDLGLHPGGGHGWMLSHAVGHQTASALLLFGEELDGDQAADVGLVWKSFPTVEAMEIYTTKLATRAASAPRPVVERTTATLRGTRSGSHQDAVDQELQQQIWTLQQPWFSERLQALKNRRK